MNNTFDLWSLLEKYEVVIPVIQRDYAQGRKDKKYIRRAFLKELGKALCEEIPVTLDFVYGNIEDHCFCPIDGQQRLTTLWLVYWYISFRAGALKKDGDILKKFTYETRASSADFCRALCEELKNKTEDDIKKYPGIAEFIKAQTWFYSDWLQDPTVSAMLRAIGGDGSADGDGPRDDDDQPDNIEACFKDRDHKRLRALLKDRRMISFELMVIGSEKLPVSDDLYIKMNARGKQLTDFENFKADLVAWIQNDENPDSDKFKEKIGSRSYRFYFPARIDNKWTDVFWNDACERMGADGDKNIDGPFFSFINRFALNELCVDSAVKPAEFVRSGKEEGHKDERAAFDKLFGTGLKGSSADDSLISYEGFDVYKKYLGFDALKRLDHIFDTISDKAVMAAIDSELKIKDADEEDGKQTSGYSFLPRRSTEQGHALLTTTQKERVYFLAVCLFVCLAPDIAGSDEIKFGRWMRVVRNLTENAAINNIRNMVVCMRLIKELADELRGFDNDIYECLKNYEGSFYKEDSSGSRLSAQLKEEKEKAEKILSDSAWEDKIKDAENFGFFNGTIRFLYRNAETVDWDDFDKKYETAKELFESLSFTKAVNGLLRRFKSFDEIKDKYLFTTVGYHPRHKCWKTDILCSGELRSEVHSLLTGGEEPEHDEDYKYFLESGLVDSILGKQDSYKYRYHWHSYWSIHKEYSQKEGVYVSGERRAKNKELKKLADEHKLTITDSDFNFWQKGYYWGVRVGFELDGSKYIWCEEYENHMRTDKIYRVINGQKSQNAFKWTDGKDLTEGIRDFKDW